MNNNEKAKAVIRSELNIEKWPLFTTSNYKGKSKEIVRTVKLPNGNIDVRKVVVGKINDVEVGVFRIFDFKGFCALVQLWEEQGRPLKDNVYFSAYKIADVMGITWSGKSYKLIKEMMMRLRKIPIDWVNSFYIRETKENERLIESFTILSDLKLFERGTKHNQPTLAISSFSFDKRLVANWLANYSKPLILDVIFKFQKEVSVLLYRYIDLIMNDKNHFERKTKELLVELDLSQDGYPYPAQRKKLFTPVIDELRGVRITSGIITKAELVKTKDGSDWKVVFDKRPESFQQIKQLPTKPPVKEDSLEEMLIKRGIAHEVAIQLCKDYNEQLIKEKIQIFDILLEGKSNQISKNPPGWLRMAIERDFVAPVTIESEADKKRAREAVEAQKQAMEKQSDIESFINWIKTAPEKKIWWEFEKWKKDYKLKTGKEPTKEEIQQKKQDLINILPDDQTRQLQIFGEILYTKEDIENLKKQL